ncbi:hypothetical protein BJ508DRAFT_410830 [Ascobolus immersus RN42]|uniref:Succinate dehydrogenase assembly factor 4, mitochondrial n=1 Tax=Ascobolus immersus RN42 TaxID=1160509 RepID=A0A3N4IMG8_ASCIM|nr:hypothetical protein BJ508DRAFT_410830 [Ascobolus immersus RN42]
MSSTLPAVVSSLTPLLRPTATVLAPTLTRCFTNLNRPRPPPLPKAQQAEWEELIRKRETPFKSTAERKEEAPFLSKKARRKLREDEKPITDEDLLAGFSPEIRDRLLGKTIPDAQKSQIIAEIRAMMEEEGVEPGQAESSSQLKDAIKAIDVSLDEGITEDDLKSQMGEEEMHPDYRRGAEPEFEGDVNPKTGEVGGPKREPVRKWIEGDWSYNGRATDF